MFHNFATSSAVCVYRLQLLNSTVSQIAKAVNQVLTKAYNYLYVDDDDDGEEPAQLKLQTAPLAASEEIEKLFTAGIVDLETALPAALHALGATTDEVEKALKRGMEKEQKKCDCEDEDRKLAQEDRKLNMKERTLGLEKTKADIKKVCSRCLHAHSYTPQTVDCLVRAQTEHDARAPFSTAASGSGGER